MFEIIAVLALIIAALLLCILSVIDLREGLLPNEYVMGLAMAGAVFHVSAGFFFLTLEDMALGALIGGAFLYIVRAAANRFYQQDSLGLGDVKLLAAAGVWLGPYYILMAITAGAAAGILHGVGLALHKRAKTGTMPSMHDLALPAGPGFAAGIALTAVVQFETIGKILAP